MTAIKSELRDTLRTWAILAVSVTFSAILYVVLVLAGFAESHALLVSSGILFTLLLTARGNDPKVLGDITQGVRHATSRSRIPSNEDLSRAVSVLRREGVTDFEFSPSIGQSALIVHVPKGAGNQIIGGPILSALGDEPLLFVTIGSGGDENHYLATFTRALSEQVISDAQEAARRARDKVSLDPITPNQARDLLRVYNDAQRGFAVPKPT